MADHRTVLRQLEPGKYARDGARKALPVLRLFRELPASLTGELIELRLPVVFGRTPFRRDQTLLFEPVQRRVERSLIHLQHVFRQLLDALRDTPSMHRLT